MNAINTNLTTSGNSVAIRLPKELLRMSGLGNNVKLEAKEGKIIISKLENIRDGWDDQIKSLVLDGFDPTSEFDDINELDDFENLPWDGPSFEEWKQNNE